MRIQTLEDTVRKLGSRSDLHQVRQHLLKHHMLLQAALCKLLLLGRSFSIACLVKRACGGGRRFYLHPYVLQA